MLRVARLQTYNPAFSLLQNRYAEGGERLLSLKLIPEVTAVIYLWLLRLQKAMPNGKKF